MIYKTVYVKRTTGNESVFFMRFSNTTGSSVAVTDLNYLVTPGAVTGSPVLLSAVVERSSSVDDVKGGGNTINSFVVANNESCVFRMTWNNGLFCLAGDTSTGLLSYRNIVRSAGCRLVGNYNIPVWFMSYLFFNCVNYNQQAGDIFDVSRVRATSIANFFMNYTWFGCSSLTNAISPTTFNWTIGSIGVQCMYATWMNCSSLLTCEAPDTSLWSVSGSPGGFLGDAWSGAYTSNPSTRELTLKGSLYVTQPLHSNSGGLTNTRITNIKVDSGLIPSYQSNANWSNITPSTKFISW